MLLGRRIVYVRYTGVIGRLFTVGVLCGAVCLVVARLLTQHTELVAATTALIGAISVATLLGTAGIAHFSYLFAGCAELSLERVDLLGEG